MDPLANVIWHALSGPQMGVSQGGPLARRFDPEISVFSAMPDEASPETWAALAELVGPGNLAMLFRPDLEAPEDWRLEFGGLGRQMIWNGDRRALEPVAPGGPSADAIVVLGPDDSPDMVDLVARTEPGPFTPRTHELGTYLGVRSADDGRLLAMAGQRFRPPGHIEISAVCTDPEARGQGLARLLVARLVEEISDGGDVPMLHVAAHNTGAIRLYEAMGFVMNWEGEYRALVAPDGTTGAEGQATG